MGILLCQPGSGVWEFSAGLRDRISCPFEWPCAPCANAACMAVCCQKSRECMLLERKSGKEIIRMPCVPGVSEACLSDCGRYVYQLSSEADCIHTVSTANGGLMFAAPVGVFPRCMRMAKGGRLLLCAGGAVNEAVMFRAPELTAAQVIQTRYPCFLADFWREGLVLVCAAEGEDIRTVIEIRSFGKETPRNMMEMPGCPGGLCVCPDGVTALVSTRAGLYKINLYTGRCMWNCPEWAMCMRIACFGKETLISDTLDGSVWLFSHQRPRERSMIAQSEGAQACFLC